MSDFWPHLLLLFAGTLIAAFSQLFLKSAATRDYKNFLARYINGKTFSGYLLLTVSTVCSLFAFRKVPLSFSPLAEASAQIFTALVAFFFLKEQIDARKAIGLLVILVGMVIMAL